MIDRDPDVMSVAQVAERLNITTARVRQLVLENKLPSPSELGPRTQVWRRADVEAIATTLRKEGAVTGVARLLAPATRALTRVFDDVVEYPAWFGPAGHVHVRIFVGPAVEGERTVGILGDLTGEVASVQQHIETIVQLLDERLPQHRGANTTWFQYSPHRGFGSSPEHHVDNVILRINDELPHQGLRSRLRNRGTADWRRRYTEPSWSPSRIAEVESVIGRALECYPHEAYVPETIARWQRVGATVPFTIDPDQLRPRFAALESLEQVPADAPRHPTAIVACSELAHSLTLSLDLVAHSTRARNDGTTPLHGPAQKGHWPQVFAARLERYTPGPVEQRRLELHAAATGKAPAPDGPALADLLHQLLLWEVETGPYADDPQPRLHTAIETAVEITRGRLARTAPEHLPRQHALHQPRPFEVVGKHDLAYLERVTWSGEQTPIQRMLRAKLPSDPTAQYDYRYGRDPWNRAVAHAQPSSPDHAAWVAIDWPSNPPREIPTGTNLVADGDIGSRPVYLQYPDGRLDPLPRTSDRDWNFGYGGGGPGALARAIAQAIADFTHADIEALPQTWIEDQVHYSSQEHLHISIDELWRRTERDS